MLVCRSDGAATRGVYVPSLSRSASVHSRERIAASTLGSGHLVKARAASFQPVAFGGRQQRVDPGVIGGQPAFPFRDEALPKNPASAFMFANRAASAGAATASGERARPTLAVACATAPGRSRNISAQSSRIRSSPGWRASAQQQ